jgi:hypothetical protein
VILLIDVGIISPRLNIRQKASCAVDLLTYPPLLFKERKEGESKRGFASLSRFFPLP